MTASGVVVSVQWRRIPWLIVSHYVYGCSIYLLCEQYFQSEESSMQIVADNLNSKIESGASEHLAIGRQYKITRWSHNN